jgi:curved DNA-binding protein CbpA
MSQGKNYYQILQVDPSAEPEIITAAYKRLSIKYHPDTNQSNDATRRMQEINEAYQVLKDPASRAHYDLYINSQSTSAEPDSGNGYHPEENTPPAESVSKSTPPTGPQYNLANFIVSLSFPITYVLLVFLLFRFFRSPSIIVILAIVIIAGYISYKVSARIQRYFGIRS